MKVTHVDHLYENTFSVQLNNRFFINVVADYYPVKNDTEMEVVLSHGVSQDDTKYQIKKHYALIQDALQDYVSDHVELLGYSLNVEPDYEPLPITL